ncbi:unnamed protein product [Rotaria socialis]|uniref:Reverse transcriptase n=1 Tax=Rotaria socialis TaxID=392032 RepID=A0A818TX15_9BILA|nr:unnamed protein product [Rotaria socialis]
MLVKMSIPMIDIRYIALGIYGTHQWKTDGSITYVPKKKADIFASAFDAKKNDIVLKSPSTCPPDAILTSLAFPSSELKSLILDLDQSGGTDPNGLFPLFFIKVADILAPKLAVVILLLVRQGSFPECCRIANVTALPKGSTPSTSPSEYRPISITPKLSKVFERLLAKRLSGYMLTIL